MVTWRVRAPMKPTPHACPPRPGLSQVRPCEKCRLFPSMKPENRLDLAEARGWVDAVFVVVGLAASGRGDQHRAQAPSLQSLWVEGARKLEKLLWPALQACAPPARGQERRGPPVPQGRGPGVWQLPAGAPGVDPEKGRAPPVLGVTARLAWPPQAPGGCCPVFCLWGLLSHLLWGRTPEQWAHKPQ